MISAPTKTLEMLPVSRGMSYLDKQYLQNVQEDRYKQVKIENQRTINGFSFTTGRIETTILEKLNRQKLLKT